MAESCDPSKAVEDSKQQPLRVENVIPQDSTKQNVAGETKIKKTKLRKVKGYEKPCGRNKTESPPRGRDFNKASKTHTNSNGNALLNLAVVSQPESLQQIHRAKPTTHSPVLPSKDHNPISYKHKEPTSTTTKLSKEVNSETLKPDMSKAVYYTPIERKAEHKGGNIATVNRKGSSNYANNSRRSATNRTHLNNYQPASSAMEGAMKDQYSRDRIDNGVNRQRQMAEIELSPEFMLLLEENKIHSLKKKNQKFPKANFFCRICDYHLDLKEDCEKHIKDVRHCRKKETNEVDALLRNLNRPTENQLSALTMAVEIVYEKNALNEVEQKERADVVSRLEKELREKNPNVILFMFGSSLTGLGLKAADINVDLSTTDMKLTALLKEVYHFLCASTDSEFSNVRSDFSSKVPGLLLTDNVTGLTVNMAINCYHAHCSSQLLSIYADFDIRVKKLAVAFRFWAHLCWLDRHHDGFIPPHALNLMVIYFLQNINPQVVPIIKPPRVSADVGDYSKDAVKFEKMRAKVMGFNLTSRNTMSIGELWLRLLKFYSLEFDTPNVVVCIRTSDGVSRYAKPWNSKRLAVEDPYIPKKNVTRMVNNTQVNGHWQDSMRRALYYFGLPRDADGRTDSSNHDLKRIMRHSSRTARPGTQETVKRGDTFKKAIEAREETVKKANEATEETVKTSNEATEETVKTSNEVMEETVETCNEATGETVKTSNEVMEETAEKGNEAKEETVKKVNQEKEETVKKVNQDKEETAKKINQAKKETFNKVKEETVKKVKEKTVKKKHKVAKKEIAKNVNDASEERVGQINKTEEETVEKINQAKEETAMIANGAKEKVMAEWQTGFLDSQSRNVEAQGDQKCSGPVVIAPNPLLAFRIPKPSVKCVAQEEGTSCKSQAIGGPQVVLSGGSGPQVVLVGGSGPQTVLSGRSGPQTVLSGGSGPQTVLSGGNWQQAFLSGGGVQQAVLSGGGGVQQAFLSGGGVQQAVLSGGGVQQAVLSGGGVQQAVLSGGGVRHAVLSGGGGPHVLRDEIGAHISSGESSEGCPQFLFDESGLQVHRDTPPHSTSIDRGHPSLGTNHRQLNNQHRTATAPLLHATPRPHFDYFSKQAHQICHSTISASPGATDNTSAKVITSSVIPDSPQVADASTSTHNEFSNFDQFAQNYALSIVHQAVSHALRKKPVNSRDGSNAESEAVSNSHSLDCVGYSDSIVSESSASISTETVTSSKCLLNESGIAHCSLNNIDSTRLSFQPVDALPLKCPRLVDSSDHNVESICDLSSNDASSKQDNSDMPEKHGNTSNSAEVSEKQESVHKSSEVHEKHRNMAESLEVPEIVESAVVPEKGESISERQEVCGNNENILDCIEVSEKQENLLDRLEVSEKQEKTPDRLEVSEKQEKTPDRLEVSEKQEKTPDRLEVSEKQKTPDSTEAPEKQETTPDSTEVSEKQEKSPEKQDSMHDTTEVPIKQGKTPDSSEVPEKQEKIPDSIKVSEKQNIPDSTEVPEKQEKTPDSTEVPEKQEKTPDSTEVPEKQDNILESEKVPVQNEILPEVPDQQKNTLKKQVVSEKHETDIKTQKQDTFSILPQRSCYYEFSEATLTDGKGPILICTYCDADDHQEKNCPNDALPEILPLPQLTPYHMTVLSETLSKVPAEVGLSEEGLLEREQFMKALEDFIQIQIKDAQLSLFGSTCNGFGFDKSDMDICLTFPQKKTAGKAWLIENLAKRLKQHPDLANVQAIPTAKVPIVKFTVRKTRLDGDISLYNILAQQNTKLLLCYSKIDPRVSILGYTIKTFAKVCDIGDASRGSLSSYAYILMMLYYLQQVEPPVIPVLQELYKGEKRPDVMIEGWDTWFMDDLSQLDELWPEKGRNQSSVAELWVGFLCFYVEEFKHMEYVVSIRQKEQLTRFEKLWNGTCLAIEDPFDLNHNLGSGLTRKMHNFILKTFINGRMLYGSPVDDNLEMFNKYQSASDYFFDTDLLSECRPPNVRGCRRCGKIGHLVRHCPAANKDKEEEQKKLHQQQQHAFSKALSMPKREQVELDNISMANLNRNAAAPLSTGMHPNLAKNPSLQQVVPKSLRDMSPPSTQVYNQQQPPPPRMTEPSNLAQPYTFTMPHSSPVFATLPNRPNMYPFNCAPPRSPQNMPYMSGYQHSLPSYGTWQQQHNQMGPPAQTSPLYSGYGPHRINSPVMSPRFQNFNTGTRQFLNPGSITPYRRK